MQLIRWKKTTENIHKKICCVGRTDSYMEELHLHTEIFSHIICVVDSHLSVAGQYEIHGKSLPLYPWDHLKELDFNETAILITDDYYREYYDRVKETLGQTPEIQHVYFWADQKTSYELAYREFYQGKKLENIIVFRSGPHESEYVEGMDFADNARALFEYMLTVGLNRKYELVWLVKNPEAFTRYQAVEHVRFLPFEGAVSRDASVRDQYYRVLCLAKFFFFTDAYGFVRNCSREQVRVQLWHGCGFKRRLNRISCEKRYDYMTVTSKLYAKLHAEEFGLRKEQMLITGLAKEDWLFEQNAEMWDKLGIPEADKYIFWLPTYRFSEESYHKPVDGTLNEKTGLPLFWSVTELERLNELLAEKNICLVIKLHPFQNKKVVLVPPFSHIFLLDNALLVKNDIPINRILGFADALISDYSSAAVDYLLLDRPMAFLVGDLADYKLQRGFIYPDIENWLPGTLIDSPEEYLRFVREVAEGKETEKEKRQKLKRQFHQYTDAYSSHRIVEQLHIE